MSQAERIQRLVAVEFERRGWTYSLDAGRIVSQSVTRGEGLTAQDLAGKIDRQALSRSAPSRTAVAEALVAVLDLAKVTGPEEEASQVRLLFVAAGPHDEDTLRLAAEHRDIRAAIRSSTKREAVVMDSTLAARPGDLIDELNRHEPTILHLAGHGGRTGIALEDEEGFAVDVDTDHITRLISVAGDALRLVVLNTCQSASQAAPIAEQVDFAIGMSDTVDDDAARTFAVQLYSSLAEGVPMQRAFDQACLQVALVGLPDQDVPQLFVKRGADASTATLI